MNWTDRISVDPNTCHGKVMVKEHDLFLAGLDQEVIISKKVLREFSAADDDDEIEEPLAQPANTVPATGYDILRLRAALSLPSIAMAFR